MEEQIIIKKEENKNLLIDSEKEKTGLKGMLEKDEEEIITSTSNTHTIAAQPLKGNIIPGRTDTEVIKEPVYDRNVSKNQIITEEEEQLVKTAPKFGDLREAGPPEGSIQAAGREVLQDRSRSSDSFAMESVKREIRRLNDLITQKASPVTQLRQYDWLIYLCQEKYLAGKRANSSYRQRHEKVRRFLDRCRTERQNLLQRHPDARGEAYLKEERQENKTAADSIMNGNNAMKGHADTLTAALSSYLPMTQEAFGEAQQTLLRAYDALIADYRSETEATCFRRATKIRREKAQRILLQLTKERELFAGYTFNAKATNTRRRWSEELVQDNVRNVTAQSLQGKGEIYQKSDQGQELTRMFADIIGASGYYVTKEKVHHTGKNEDGYAMPGDTVSLTETIARAHNMGVDLMYSMNATAMMNTIQIIDMILGVTNRSNDDIKVKAYRYSIENKDYLVITDVRILDKAPSFGIEKFDDLNQQAEDGSKKELVNQQGKLLTGVYSTSVADRILNLDPNLMRNYFMSAGLSEEKTEAFLDRLSRIKTTLQTDKDNKDGIRHKAAAIVEEIGRAQTNIEQKQAEEEFEDYTRDIMVKNAAHTYVDKTFIQDNGIVNSQGMEKVNRRVDNDLKTEKKVRRVKNTVLQYVTQAREEHGQDAMDPQAEQVLSALKEYADTSFTGQGVSYLNVRYHVHSYIKKVDPDHYREIENEVKTQLINTLTAQGHPPQNGIIPKNQLNAAVIKKIQAHRTTPSRYRLRYPSYGFQ